MKNIFLICLVLSLLSCGDDDVLTQNTNLEQYLEMNADRSPADLIACAGGKENGLFNIALEPTSVFFYPIAGASDFRYFETTNVADSLDFSKYIEKELVAEPIFNGYLWKFNNLDFEGERMGVVTYITPGNLHTCTPIRLKTNVKPTEVNPSLAMVDVNGINPIFQWEDGLIDDTVIYFQIISDSEGNLISGTYTYERKFTFYELDNVVLNITDPKANTVLEPNTEYGFTLMAVSEDNWVNLFSEFNFTTE